MLNFDLDSANMLFQESEHSKTPNSNSEGDAKPVEQKEDTLQTIEIVKYVRYKIETLIDNQNSLDNFSNLDQIFLRSQG